MERFWLSVAVLSLVSLSLTTLPACGGDGEPTPDDAAGDTGADADAAVRSIKRRLAESHGIEHATVEPEFGACADAKPEHEHH